MFRSRDIDQRAIDAAALALFPAVPPATRNQKVYAPVSPCFAMLDRDQYERLKESKGH
jgi:hypothetical protein